MNYHCCFLFVFCLVVFLLSQNSFFLFCIIFVPLIPNVNNFLKCSVRIQHTPAEQLDVVIVIIP